MKVGFTCGAFDLFHAGHVHMLGQASNHCDTLIVGLHTDPTIDRKEKNKPIQTVYERYIQLIGCKYVTNVVPYDTELDLCNMLATLPINIRFIGEDYLGSTNITGEDLCKQLNIEIKYLSRRHSYSTSELRNRVRK